MCMKMSGRSQRLQLMAQQNEEKAAADQSRQQEDARQARLGEGMNRSNDLFNRRQTLPDGTTVGFDDKYYNDYRNEYLNYYNPEVQKQFENAKDELTYSHARAGTLISSMATKNLADLVYQNDINKGQIASKADAATGELRKNVDQQKAALTNQLYSTENPDIATNSALNSVKTIANTSPDFQPLGEMFKNAVVGGANFYNAYTNPYARLGGVPTTPTAAHTVT